MNKIKNCKWRKEGLLLYHCTRPNCHIRDWICIATASCQYAHATIPQLEPNRLIRIAAYGIKLMRKMFSLLDPILPVKEAKKENVKL